MTYELAPRLSVGLEYNPKAGNFAPLANLRLLNETKRRPALMLGTSSDRIGTPSGQSYYLTLAKDLEPQIGAPLAPYVGIAYGTYEDKTRFIAGLNVRFSAGLSSLVIFDGVHVHPTATYSRGRHGLTLVLVRARHPGVSYNVRF